jgi:hypothetical protein
VTPLMNPPSHGKISVPNQMNLSSPT